MKVTAIILAGGKSRRMGGDNKAFVKYHELTLLEHALLKAEKFSEVLIVSSDDNFDDYISWLNEDSSRLPLHLKSKIRVVKDEVKEKGPLGGIYTGLMHSKHDRSVVMPVDTPLLPEEYFDFLLSKSEAYDGVTAKVNGYMQPACAVYNRSVKEKIGRLIEVDTLSLRKAIGFLDVLVIDEPDLISCGLRVHQFTNVNSMDELRRLLDIDSL